VVLTCLPRYRPADLLALWLSLAAAALLVVAAGVGGLDGRQDQRQRDRDLKVAASPPRSAGPPPPEGSGQHRADPAALSIDRWLPQWPGMAGACALSWWAARLGAAGLLSALAFGALGTDHYAAVAAAAVAGLALLSVAPGRRRIMAVALGAVATAGALVTVSGLVALFRGGLSTPLLPPEGWWPTGGPASALAVRSGTTVVVLCLGAACLLPFVPTPPARPSTPTTPAPSSGAGRRAKWALRAGAGIAVLCWGLAVPALVRAGGLGSLTVAVLGAPRAMTAALSVALGPVGGPHAAGMARGALFVTCLAGAFGAAGAGTALAGNALSTARSVRSVRSGHHGAPARAQGASPRSLPGGLAWRDLEAAAATGLVAGGAALLGPRPWLVVTLGALATGALGLTALAPPLPRQRQRLPGALKVAVAVLCALALAGALGGAGPWAVAAAGSVTLMGAVAAGPKRLRAGVLAVFPPTRRRRAEHLGHAASTLADKALPALAGALDALASGQFPRLPANELAELKAAVRLLESDLAPCGRSGGPCRHSGGPCRHSGGPCRHSGGPCRHSGGPCRHSGGMAGLTKALVDASKQVARLAASVETVARLDSIRLEELVEVRIGALAHANRNLVDSQWRRRQLLDRTVRVAEEERARIAANLHDGPIQRLAALGLVLDRCRLRLDRDDKNGARDLVKRARTELSEEIRSLRQTMSDLRPPILDEGGLEAALQDHLSSWTGASGIEIRFEASPHGLLSLDSETVVYRVVQEALANVAKHSRANLTTVSISQSGRGVQVVVRDNGRGFNAPSQPDLLRGGHFGLVVMRERVELASGRFEIISAPRTGTELVVWLPTVSANEPVGVA
jgi:signal transduction histidine kinase